MRLRKAQSTDVQRQKESVQLRDQALQGIRNLILDSQDSSLRDGALTSERNIAEQLGISRTPVREALAVLEQLGVLNQVPQVGIQVRQISLDEAVDVLRIRGGMETAAVERIADNTHTNQATVADLESVIQDMERLQNDVHRFMKADTSFHCSIVRCGGLGSRVGIIQSLRDLIHLHRLQQHALTSRPEMADIVSEHANIVKALRGGGEAAVKAVDEHLASTLERLRNVSRSRSVVENRTAHAAAQSNNAELSQVAAEQPSVVAVGAAARR
jgi:DNA-binding GntR family transcriptional regulator